MEKAYHLGLIVGRFQMIHNGHMAMIDTALRLCERVGVFVGSSQEAGTVKNPFSYEMRERMLRTLYGESIAVSPLPDIGVGNTALWGDYVIARAAERFGAVPDLLVSGKEERRTEWLSGDRGDRIAELYIPKAIDISACRMRELLIDGRFDSWKAYCDERLWDSFDQMRELVLLSQQNTSTSSV